MNNFNYLDSTENEDSNVSAYLTIQEGCDKFCNFCVVPFTRGPEFSRPFDKVMLEAEKLVKNGAKEIILLGQNVNAYSYKDQNKEYRLSNLINNLEKMGKVVDGLTSLEDIVKKEAQAANTNRGGIEVNKYSM